MRLPRMDDSLALARRGYGWLPERRRQDGRRTVRGRLLGLPVLAVEGPEGARFVYDEDHVRRAHAIPEPVQATLFGKGAVHTLDGPEHRVRKQLFVDLLVDDTPGRPALVPLVERVTAAWDDAVPGWARQGSVVLFDEAARVLTRGVCGWAGVPLEDDGVPAMARDLTAMVDGFATGGPRHWRARRARNRREAELAHLVADVRGGRRAVPAGSVVDAVARHRDASGEQLDPRVAAVEVLNVVRPTVAVSWFVAFAAHALLHWPGVRERLAAGDPAYAEAFAHELRRFYPFAPFIGGRAPRAVEFDGVRVPAHAMVLVDLYDTDHDRELWEDPSAFRPERFLDREIDPWELVPQGAGDPRTGHRCPGEQITVALLSALGARLARLRADVPEQDLTISLRRIPALPADRVVLRVHGTG
ncbi:cytochrome P450 [Geodermatophilus marinus]|uniref:cytochrome P450 n=1 Tax=Geodermatophilus sp. LHW52908 TaxID=2303986 RepID=UPI000E3D7E14|nr:cytochrome P450 [Geodermatophilus sp. LHW52908]RFU21206.1 cytochrome P450 [Geodermatophilus sp. LHW52908]